MELNESDHKKMIAQLRQSTATLVEQYPFSRAGLRPYRNLLYLIQKEQSLTGEEFLGELKSQLKSPEVEQRLSAIKLLSSLPLRERLSFLDSNESEIIQLSQAEDYNFEVVASLIDCLGASYQLISRFPEVYSVSVNRVMSLYCKLLENIFHRSKEMTWNSLEALRSVAAFAEDNDFVLIDKIANSFSARMEEVLCRIVMFEARVRARLLYGYTVLIVRCTSKHDLLPRVINELLLIANSLTDYQPIYQSIKSLLYILTETKQSQHVFNRLLKTCHYLVQSMFRLEYLPLLTTIVVLAEHCNNRLKYEISLRALEASRTFQQQYTRLVIMKCCLRNLYQISKQYPAKRESVIRSLFLQTWFIKFIKEEHDVFKEEFLMMMISEFFEEGTEELNDVLDICHRLLDWTCTSQNAEAVRFAFELYLRFLKEAWQRLGKAISPNINELVDRINQKNIHFLFKMKVLSLLSGLLTYHELKRDLNFDFIQGQLRPFMMPKNPKQIFSASYARSAQGQNESVKEVEYIKNILHLLATLPQNYKELSGQVDNLVAEYQGYLGKLESLPDCNRDLINALFELEDQPITTDVGRNFLLATYKQTSELSVYRQPYPVPYSFFNNSETSILPCDSPIDLLVTPLKYSNFKVLLGIRTISYIQTGSVRLLISTSLQCVEVEFESGIVEIQVEAPGVVHFEVLTETGSSLGKGTYKLLIASKWRRIDWYACSGGVKLKVCWEGRGFTARYLGIYWGQPIVISLEEGSTELSLYLCSKHTAACIMSDLQQLLDELTEGTISLKS